MAKLRLCFLAAVFATIFALGPLEVSPAGEDTEVTRVKRIIGGQRTNLDKFPWMVSLRARRGNYLEAALFARSESYCGGTIIDKKWILTAAHCLYATDKKGRSINFENPKDWHIRFENEKLRPGIRETIVGAWNRFMNKFFNKNKKQTFYHVSKVIRHPSYIPGILENDVALLKIKEDIDYSRFGDNAFLRLPADDTSTKWPAEGQNCMVLGWGCDRVDGAPTETVKKLKVPIVSGRECRRIYVSSINLTDTKEFCAGYYNGRMGICPGDSGGPLACDLDGGLHLAGVVSATHAKKPGSYPGIFTRVTYFAPWIRSIISRY